MAARTWQHLSLHGFLPRASLHNAITFTSGKTKSTMWAFRRLKRHDQPSGLARHQAFDQYVSSATEQQNAIDLQRWNCALPSEAGVIAGPGILYADARLTWAIERCGGVKDREVLEIGPMEASHTYMLEKAGARVKAVEANKLAYLKCLIAKEVLEKRSFLAKKGDVLFWHANLVHGGMKREVESQSRKALVCHYFAESTVTYHDLSGNLSRLHKNGLHAPMSI